MRSRINGYGDNRSHRTPNGQATFTPHAAANGLDICRDPGFGFEGQAFVALFGDLAPVTVRSVTPAGFKIARVDLERRQVVDFAVNRLGGPASKLPHQGFERPSHCQFGPDGALYMVDGARSGSHPRWAESAWPRAPGPCGASARPARRVARNRRDRCWSPPTASGC